MPDAHTTNLNLTLPEIGLADNTWGKSLNDDLVIIDNLFATAPRGGTGLVVREDGEGNAACQGVSISNVSGLARPIYFKSSGSTRWAFFVATQESGGNSGSDLYFLPYDDSGAALNIIPMILTRATGDVTFRVTPRVQLGGVGPLYNVYHEGNLSATLGAISEPIGTIKMWAGVNTADPPASSDGIHHYLICDGRSVLVNSYPALFAVVAYTYGGSGANFNLPNFQERVPVGQSLSGTPGVPQSNILGRAIGEASHVLAAGELPAHVHPITDKQHEHYIHPSGASQSGGGGGPLALGPGVSTDIHTSFAFTGITSTDNNTGAGGPHNNVQPSLVVNYIIRVL